jgi:hypothetical protein
MSDPRLQRLNETENLAVGLATGVVDVSLTQWMLYCKNASQQGMPLTLNPKILYRGTGMSMVNMSVLSGLQLPLTATCQGLFTGGVPRKLSDGELVGAGLIGGALSGFACAPMELVLIQQQRFGTSLLATPAKVVAEAGVAGLFGRGLAMSCGREGIFTAGMLGMGPVIKRGLLARGQDEASANVIAAVGCGVVVATSTHPMDTIKTNQQGDVAGAKYRGVLDTAAKLLKEQGVRRFFSGWSWRTGRMIIEVFLFDQCRMLMSPVFFPHHFQD